MSLSVGNTVWSLSGLFPKLGGPSSDKRLPDMECRWVSHVILLSAMLIGYSNLHETGSLFLTYTCHWVTMDEYRMNLRIIHKEKITKMVLKEKPTDMGELTKWIQDHVGVPITESQLFYFDEEFGNDFSLDSTQSLLDKMTIKIKALMTTPPAAACSVVDNVETVPKEPWPTPYPLPTFEPDIQTELLQRNSGAKTDPLTKGSKGSILKSLCSSMYLYKTYPTDKDYEVVARRLITVHPGLKDRGSPTGYEAWTTSLKFAMARFRTKLGKAGCEEVAVNCGKRSKYHKYGEYPAANIKKPRKGEVLYLPHVSATEPELKQKLKEEMKKKQKDMILISDLMQKTFASRRKALVGKDALTLLEIQQEWPALFMLSQLNADFLKITNIPSVLDMIDPHLDRLLAIMRTRTGKMAPKIQQELQLLDSCEKDENLIIIKRAVVLRSLPVYFIEDPFFQDYDETASREEISSVDGLHIATVGTLHSPTNICVILEKIIAYENLHTFAEAFETLFQLIYALDLAYPKKSANTFHFVQKVLLKLNQADVKMPKVMTLRRKLFE